MKRLAVLLTFASLAFAQGQVSFTHEKTWEPSIENQGQVSWGEKITVYLSDPTITHYNVIVVAVFTVPSSQPTPYIFEKIARATGYKTEIFIPVSLGTGDFWRPVLVHVIGLRPIAEGVARVY
jgi:hypothetical protein